MQLAHGAMLLPQKRDAAVQRVCDLQLVVVQMVLAIGLFIDQGQLHLLDSRN